ncbi:MAG: SDR family NAD(P)-dependent oxidoreductase [Gammaproteobacteria bacterium]
MNETRTKVAVVAGMGEGLSLALAQGLLAEGYCVAGLSRSGKERPELGDRFIALACDLADASALDSALSEVERVFGHASVYIHNASQMLRSDFLDTSADDFEAIWRITCQGAVHGAQRVLPGMLSAGGGTILFTGATASVKAGGGFAAFSSAKFALRGLAQSLAREFGPQGVHVAHVLIDGIIWSQRAQARGMTQDQCLSAADIAASYLHLINQPRSTWTQELDLRPDVETF